MRRKHFWTEDIDNEIRRVYRTVTVRNAVNELADRLRKPRWAIARRAFEIGATEPRIKEPVWSEQELGILELSAHRHTAVIRRHLKKAGYKRSEMGIFLKRKRMRFLQNMNGQSVNSLAGCFGIDAHCVTRWIDKGLLKSSNRGTDRMPQQGGDMYYIKDAWVKEFINQNIGIIDIRKVDKFWLIGILG